MVRGWAWAGVLCAVAFVACDGTSTEGGAPDTAGSSGKGAHGGSSGNGATSGNGGVAGNVGGLGGEGSLGGEGGGAGDGANAGEAGTGGVLTCSEDVLITTRDELIALAALECEVLQGSLTIQSVTLENLSDLAGSAPRRITGSLVVQQNAELTNIEGLSGLAEVAGTLVLMDNPQLPDLGGLETVEFLDSLVMGENGALSNVAALANAHVGSILVSSNAVLENVQGLGYLQGTSQVTIVNNPALTEVRLPFLEECSACMFSSNPALVTLSLPDLMGAGDLSIVMHDALTTVSLPALYDVERSFTVAENGVLTTLGSLDGLETVVSMSIKDNPALPQCFVDALDARLMACSTGCGGNDATATCD